MLKGLFCCLLLGWSLVGSWCLDICNDQVEGARLAHPADCSRFVICRQGVTAQIRYCPFGLHFNRFDAICDLQYRAGCDNSYSRQLLAYDEIKRIDCDVCHALCSAAVSKPLMLSEIKVEKPPCKKPEKPPTTPCPTSPTPKPTTNCRPTTPCPTPPNPKPTTDCRPTTPCPTPPTPKPTTDCRPTVPTPDLPTSPPTKPTKPPTKPTKPSPPTKPCLPTKPTTPKPTTPPSTKPCGPTTLPTSTPPSTVDPGTDDPSTDDPNPNPKPDPEAPQTSPSGLTCADRGKCEGQRDGALFADNSSTGYIVCQCQCEIKMPCPPTLIFNEAKQSCDWPQD